MRYIIGISNVSSQGEQCMMIPMVGLVIMVVFISNNASVVTKEDRYRWHNFRGSISFAERNALLAL